GRPRAALRIRARVPHRDADRGGPRVRRGGGRRGRHLERGRAACAPRGRGRVVAAARSDVVGSLLRPPELLAARERLARGELAPAEFKALEDAAVDDVLRRQEETGIGVVTDGELRRLSFQSELV